MNITQDFIPKGRRNRPGRANPMKFITIHNTGNTSKGAGARNHANYVKGDSAANLPVSWHYTIDEKDIYQHIPDNEDAFHAGDGGGNGNRQSIGLEVCMNSDGDLLSATDNAIKLTAHLCKKYNIPVENIVQHHRWTGKNCPQMIRSSKPYDWNTFIYRVKNEMAGSSSTPAAPAPANPSTPAASASTVKKGDTVKIDGKATYYNGNAIRDWVKNQNWIVASVSGDRAVIDKSASGSNSISSPVNTKFLTVVGGASNPALSTFQPYLVNVTSNGLNIRKGPGTNHAIVGSIREKGVYTIVEETNGTGAKKWGRLKSGAGWISLDFVQKR